MLPHLPTLAVMACAASLATLPRNAETAEHVLTQICHEKDDLFRQIQGATEQHPEAFLGDLHEIPAPHKLKNQQGWGGQGRCKVLLDRDGRHANSCAHGCHGMVTQRRNHVLSFLAAHAKRCGTTVHVEQRTGLQIREDLGDVREAEAKRPMHT